MTKKPPNKLGTPAPDGDYLQPWTAALQYSPHPIIMCSCCRVETVEPGRSIDLHLHLNWSTPLPSSPSDPILFGTLLLPHSRCTSIQLRLGLQAEGSRTACGLYLRAAVHGLKIVALQYSPSRTELASEPEH